jgi:hypothetical protein
MEVGISRRIPPSPPISWRQGVVDGGAGGGDAFFGMVDGGGGIIRTRIERR